MSSVFIIFYTPEFYMLNAVLLVLLWPGIYVYYLTKKSYIKPNFMVWLGFWLLVNVFWLTINYEKELTLQIFGLSITLLSLSIFLITNKSLLAHYQSLILENIVLRLVIIFSLLFLLTVDNLLAMFFALELYALSAYILVGQSGSSGSVYSSEAGLKYLILGVLTGILLVYGIGLIYWDCGSLNFSDIVMFYSFSPDEGSLVTWELIVGFILIVSGFLFKISAAPYHFWSPDVYEGAPTNVMVFISLVPKLALFLFLNNLYLLVLLPLTFSLVLHNYFIYVLIVSTLVGTIGALYQRKIKRFLAYSMITNTGYLVGAVAVASIFSTASFFFFLLVYLITFLGVFSILLTNSVSIHEGASKLIKNFSNLNNQFFLNPVKVMMLAILIFSFAGLPPFGGFVGKYLLLLSFSDLAVNYYFVIFIILLTTALSVFYYIRIIKASSFKQKRSWTFFDTIPISASIVASMATLLALYTFMYSGPLFYLTSYVSAVLHAL